MQILTSLLTLIVLARVLGHMFTRWGQPAIVGEMMAGILLGPALLGLVEPNPALSGIASLAIFLVVLDAGLEMNFQDVQAAMRGRGFIIAMIASTSWRFQADANSSSSNSRSWLSSRIGPSATLSRPGQTISQFSRL